MKRTGSMIRSKQQSGWHTVGRERWIPHAYQKRAVLWLIKHAEGALFLDPGLGKTSACLTAFKALRAAKGAKRMLVVAPLRPAAMVWTQSEGGELAKWEDFEDLTVSFIHGSAKKREQALEDDADIYVTNYENFGWLCARDHTKRTRIAKLTTHKGVDTLCFDELSKMKHSNTKRFKALKPWLGHFKRRWGLTGSPVANSLLDLFGQVYVLDCGKRLGRYITHYRHTYFNQTGYGGYTWIPKEKAEKQIYKKLSTLALSMKAEDHLEMPELIERNIWVDLPPKAVKAYTEMHNDLITMLENETVTAANAAVASGKCRQIASGGLYVEDALALEPHREVKHIHHAKTEALIDIIDELQGKPVLVGVDFHHDLTRIRAKLGMVVPAIVGGVNMRRSQELANAWNAGELPVLVGHPAAMAHGINLQQHGSHIVWYSLTWNYEHYDQFIRRVYRQGQKNRVFVYRILVRGTVDEAVLKSLQAKERGQHALFDALKKLKRR